MSRTIQTRSHTAHANNPEPSASDTRWAAALSTLTSLRRSPDSVSQFQGFSAQRASSPAQCCPPGAFVEDLGDDLGDDHPSDDGPGGDGPDDPDDPNPDDGSEDPIDGIPDPDEAGLVIFNNLSIAINRLARSSHSSKSSSHTKVCEPDTFNGTDPKKLCTFLVQCELNFQDRPKAFRTDRTKVTFAQSYLKGMALEWFEPDLLGAGDPLNRPIWMTDWEEFVIELQTTFGPHDPVADTEHQLDHLRMKENHCANRYVVDFNRIASQIRGYSDGTLCHHFYTGLPDRIKDEISRVGKPRTLNSLCILTQEIDARYWECKEEVARQNKTSTSTSTNTPNTKSGKTDKGKSSGNVAQSSSSSIPNPKSNKLGKTAELSDKLGKDGKLTSEECKRRFNMNLCMFCGATGHKAKDCPKSGSRAAKTRAATATTMNTSKAKPTASTKAKK